MTPRRVCPACGVAPATAGDRYCRGCATARDRQAWADAPSCADCGAPGELTGHMECPYPGRVSDRW